MKKILIYVIVLFTFFLTGCSNPFDKYVKLVEVPTEVSDTFYLPTQVINDENHDIYWTSSNPDIIKISNSNIIQIEGLLYYTVSVSPSSVDTKVVLTMTLEVVNKGTITKEYEVTVLKMDVTKQDEIEFTFFSLNDFHGTVIDDNGGISVIGNYIINEKNKFPETTIIVSSGDMFQGSAISNMTQGGVVVEAMNEIGFDAMAVGNHEFDWGIDVIKQYNNKTSEVKSNFPIICANIYEKETDKPVDWCDPYVIIEKAGIKIGIIGAIGSELESSIATAMVAPYEFKDPLPIVKEYTKKLRTELNCEIVVLAIHDNTLGTNQIFADLTGDYQIDAVFNGHTHSTYAGDTMGSDNTIMPYIQSGSYGSNIGKIVIKYNKVNKKIVEGSSENIKVSKSLSSTNSKLDEIVNKFNEKIKDVSEEVLGIAGTNIDQITCARWAVNVIRDYSGCEIGFINNGGIRNGAFPIRNNENITVGKVWEIMPFDNFVKTCTMTVDLVIEAYYANDVLHSDNVEVKNGELYVNGVKCNGDETFTVAAVDYIFDKTNFPFLKAENQATTGELYRDYLIQAIKDECKNGEKWNG